MNDEQRDRITLSPQVWDILNDTSVPADVFGAIAAFLVELRKNPVPQDALPVPGRPDWYSAPLLRDLGLVEYHVGDTRPGRADPDPGPDIFVARILRTDVPDF